MPRIHSSAFQPFFLPPPLYFPRGAVLTDDMEMGAILNNQDVGEATVQALVAGCDGVLICHSAPKQIHAFKSILSAVSDGRLSLDRLKEAASRMTKLASPCHRHLSDSAIDLDDLVGCSQHAQLVRDATA